MLLSYTTLYLVGAGVAVVAIALLIRAKMLEQAFKGSGKKFTVAGWGLIIVGVIGAAYIGFGTKQVYVFYGSADHGARIEHDKACLVGSSSSVKLHDGKSLTIPPEGVTKDDVYIVNDTDRQLVVEVAQYSTISISFGSNGERKFNIAVGGVDSIGSVTNIGPDDPLPASVESESSSATRTWVSW